MVRRKRIVRKKRIVRRKRKKGTAFQRCMRAKLKGKKFTSRTALRKGFKKAVRACMIKARRKPIRKHRTVRRRR